jgi:hypothetical protein
MNNEKPKLEVGIGSPDGNIFMIVINAGDLIQKDKADEMFLRVKEIMKAGKDYRDALAVVKEYVDLEFIE